MRRSNAYKGEDKFKSGKIPPQALLVVYPNRMHVVTVESTGIKTMADLKGKRVSTGSPGSATEVMAFRVIEAAGLDKDKDMKRERLGVADPSMRSRTARSTHSSGSEASRRHGDRSRCDTRREDETDRP
jgi:TRAP transporter TAXI family solute receptor